MRRMGTRTLHVIYGHHFSTFFDENFPLSFRVLHAKIHPQDLFACSKKQYIRNLHPKYSLKTVYTHSISLSPTFCPHSPPMNIRLGQVHISLRVHVPQGVVCFRSEDTKTSYLLLFKFYLTERQLHLIQMAGRRRTLFSTTHIFNYLGMDSIGQKEDDAAKRQNRFRRFSLQLLHYFDSLCTVVVL